jgi:hypothetical protein
MHLVDAPSLFFSSSSRWLKLLMVPSMEIKQRVALRFNCSKAWLHCTKERRCMKLDFEMMQCRERNDREKYLE